MIWEGKRQTCPFMGVGIVSCIESHVSLVSAPILGVCGSIQGAGKSIFRGAKKS